MAILEMSRRRWVGNGGDLELESSAGASRRPERLEQREEGRPELNPHLAARVLEGNGDFTGLVRDFRPQRNSLAAGSNLGGATYLERNCPRGLWHGHIAQQHGHVAGRVQTKTYRPRVSESDPTPRSSVDTAPMNVSRPSAATARTNTDGIRIPIATSNA
jgi:hypothetical protein